MTDIVAQQGAVASLVALARSPVAARALRAAGILATLLDLPCSIYQDELVSYYLERDFDKHTLGMSEI